jgi:toxin ParE1/3/4
VKWVTLQLSDVAINDILEQSTWYQQRSGQALAKRWEDAVTSSLIRILEHPNSGPSCGFHAEELRSVRRMSIPRFPRHLIFYLAQSDEVLILRVVHGARDWKVFFDLRDPKLIAIHL